MVKNANERSERNFSGRRNHDTARMSRVLAGRDVLSVVVLAMRNEFFSVRCPKIERVKKPGSKQKF